MSGVFIKTMALALGVTISAYSHAGFFDQVNKGLSSVNKALGLITGNSEGANNSYSTSQSVFAQASDEQLKKIATVVQTRTGTKDIDQSLEAAKENIAQMILMASCSDNWNLNFGKIQSPDESVSGWKGVLSRMPNHPSDRCATVQSIGNFSKPAKNILEFTLIYSSEISGEASTCRARLRDQYGNGNWLVSGHACSWN